MNTADFVAVLDEQLLELADGDETAIGFLALAEAHYEAADRPTELAIAGQALRFQGGTWGQRIAAWDELVEAVLLWHAWDRLADSKGRTDYLNIPSREAVCDGVAGALREICVRAKAA